MTTTESEADFVARMNGARYDIGPGARERLLSLAADGLLLRKVVEHRLLIEPLKNTFSVRKVPGGWPEAHPDLPTAIKQVLEQFEKEKA